MKPSIDFTSATVIGQHAIALDQTGRIFKLVDGKWCQLLLRQTIKAERRRSTIEQKRANGRARTQRYRERQREHAANVD